jgi:transcriptional regulator GlxA family with amidase domain
MEAKIHLPLTLVEIAEYVGSSERHFSRRFREGTEQTPKKMLIILRH